MSAPFKLGRDSLEETKKSLRALKRHSKAAEPVYFTINTTKPLVRAKDYTPRVIPLTNPLDKLGNKSVLLITKDPSTPYRHPLTEKDSPTEDVFNQIYTVTKLRRMTSNQKKAIGVFKEFDIIVADHRVHKLLPDILGAQFYVKNKKIPFVVQMAPADPNAKLVKTSKSHKLKDERCEPKYVKGQMNSIAKNTYCIIPANGTFMSIKVGFTNWPTDKLVANINDILVYFMEKKYPSGGLITNKSMIESIHIKTSDSISLPVYRSTPQDSDPSSSDFSDNDL
ncbi:hypothetical protein PSN45_000817 [Yamadazyma tenuis]|uniref:Ribosomal protein L1 n=1 Tax=Candida tenuis (strain ATCC 10573 / BCRC 21748 / CBS 615 / JCM 9827 / NBRC 10315 / NRRL Y-1498 / VKM Y-70) TaxID=590646 RepID=G3BAT4_CANTC|nr:ribosomal protein L1 [Yamadazyma tenuis ATCC 10573]EGV62108.1 ribosomal protein L1 [Yamadazyma tenuis ATCC 10573]WEJ93354.1 hypothetical protein PSN45_000817 [Yamadazyma tenuis]